MAGRSRARLRALAASLGALAAACTSAPTPVANSPVAAELRQFLPAPALLAVGVPDRNLALLYERLLAGEEPTLLLGRARALPAVAGMAAQRALLAAEARLVGGEAAGALEELIALSAEDARRPEVQLVMGRATEELGDLVGAVIRYRAAGATLPRAAARAELLEPRAAERLAERVLELLSRSRAEEAEEELLLLESWQPTSERTLDLTRRVAAARGQSGRELIALRRLAAVPPGSRELQLRLAALEMEVGEPRSGLELLAALHAKRPDDVVVARELERAKFLFKLSNAPDEVRASSRRAQLSRADFARLLFWLLPDVRTARSGTPQIAMDILDHSARDEIVRISALGLLGVDSTLHLFEPERPLRRAEAFRALAVHPGGGLRICAADAPSPSDPCAAAVACGFTSELGSCLPGASVSGAEAIDWIRGTVHTP